MINLNTQLARTLVQRGRIRGIACALSIVIAFFLYGLAMGLDKSFSNSVGANSSSRLIVAHKHSRQQSLPLSYIREFNKLPNIRAVSPRQSFGGWYQKPEQSFSQFVVDPKRDLAVHKVKGLTDNQKRLFIAGGDMVIVGEAIAKKYNFRVGQKIQLSTSLWAKQNGDERWQFTIAGIYKANESDSVDDKTMLIAHNYFKTEVPYAANLVGWFVIKLKDGVSAEQEAAKIDTLFKNYSAPTLTSSEKAYSLYMTRQFGELGKISINVTFAVILSLILSMVLFFVQSVSENRYQFAMLTALGFSNVKITELLSLGALFFCIPPAMLGLGLSHLLMPWLAQWLYDYLPGIEFDPLHYLYGLVIAVTIATICVLVVTSLVRKYSINQLREE